MVAQSGIFPLHQFRRARFVDLMAVDSRTPNVILIDVKAIVYVARTRQRPRRSEILKRLGVRLLMVDLGKGTCEFEEIEFEEEDAAQAAEGCLKY